MAEPRTTWVFSDDIGRGRCRGPRCGRVIWFAENVKSRRKQPFDELVYLETKQVEVKPGSYRPAARVDLGKAHHATCPDVQRFRQPTLL